LAGIEAALPAVPKRNRVTPLGDIVAIPLRGAWTGNRGNLHTGTEIVRFHRSPLWIICALRFKDWRLPQWAPGRFTLLFFYDEAVALAAGHRPCALCRRAAYNSYRQALAAVRGVPVPLAMQLDRALHRERLHRGTHRRQLHPASWPDVPAGTFVRQHERPALVLSDRIVPWTERGYGTPADRPGRGRVDVITPPSSTAALAGGYPVQIDVAATGAGADSGGDPVVDAGANVGADAGADAGAGRGAGPGQFGVTRRDG
jgi:hypothetical protein